VKYPPGTGSSGDEPTFPFPFPFASIYNVVAKVNEVYNGTTAGAGCMTGPCTTLLLESNGKEMGAGFKVAQVKGRSKGLFTSGV